MRLCQNREDPERDCINDLKSRSLLLCLRWKRLMVKRWHLVPVRYIFVWMETLGIKTNKINKDRVSFFKARKKRCPFMVLRRIVSQTSKKPYSFGLATAWKKKGGRKCHILLYSIASLQAPTWPSMQCVLSPQ